MGKRSPGFKKKARSLYDTPPEPVLDLHPWLPPETLYAEPCAGRGHLVTALDRLGHQCVYAADLVPLGAARRYAETRDALTVTRDMIQPAEIIITNPPWPDIGKKGQPAIGLIEHFMSLATTWVLLAADFMHNDYARGVLDRCPLIVSVGRVKWEAGSEHMGKDNAAWYCFDKEHDGPTRFVNLPRRQRYAPEIEALL